MSEGLFKLNNAPANTHEIIRIAQSLIIPKAEIKDLRCTVETKGAIPKEIFCDSRRILQLVLNLGFNAVKYTFIGSIRVMFSVSKDNTNFCIKVKDTGIGMCSKELDKVNKVFGLLDEKLVHCQTGIGLGLAISKGIASAMNGTLSIFSKPDVGTVCKVKLPIIPSQTTFESLPQVAVVFSFNFEE